MTLKKKTAHQIASASSWFICIVLTIVLSLVQGSCETAHKYKEHCPPYYNQSLPLSPSTGVSGEDLTNLLNQRKLNHSENLTRKTKKVSSKIKREIAGGFQGMKCPNVKEIKMAKDRKDFSLVHFQQPLTTIEPVIITNHSDCIQESVRNISSASKLKVVVTSCCVLNCMHEITLRTEEGYNILLHFHDFKVPGLRLASDGVSKTCHEHLDIGVETNEGGFHSVGRFCGVREPGVLFMQNNEVKFRLSLFDNMLCKDNISLTVTVSPCVGYHNDDCRDMRPNQINENEGYITSPGFDIGAYYPKYTNCSAKISVPEHKFIRIKLNVFEVDDDDFLALTPTINESFRLFPKNITYSGPMKTLPPLVLPSNESTVQFISNSVESYVGFNLTYIAVDENEFIPMFLNGSLDCSGLATIPEYLKCDIHRSCALGEDERNCTYRNSKCEADGFFYNNNCYFVIKELHNHSWRDAAHLCAEKYKAQLISINTVAESIFLEKVWEQHALKSIFLGLQRMKRGQVPQIYNRLWRWSDGRTGLYLPNEFRLETWTHCSLYTGSYFHAISCMGQMENVSVICELNVKHVQNSNVQSEEEENRDNQIQKSIPGDTFKCLHSKEYISSDLHCDRVNDCFDGSDERSCPAVKEFQCNSGQLVRYAYVCNGMYDCRDKSDEVQCEKPLLASLPVGKMMCTSGMLISRESWCDSREDCNDGSDEESCMYCNDNAIYCPLLFCFPKSWDIDSDLDCPTRSLGGTFYSEKSFKENLHYSEKPPGVVYPDGYGKVSIKPLKESETCPDTHFPCQDGFCIPVYMLCNLFMDCPYGEDEDRNVCEFECRGLYKCKYSSICLHKDHICDGIYNCPFKDDETISLCSNEKYMCPGECKCNRSEISCSASPILYKTMSFSYISIKTDQLNLNFLNKVHSYSLIFLNISRCSVETIQSQHMQFQNLLVFDASKNKIINLDNNTFENCPKLEQLFLGENGLEKLGTFEFLKSTKQLKVLDLSSNQNVELYDNCFQGTKKLQKLYLRDMGITKINKETFNGLVNLNTLDLTGNRIALFSEAIFKDQQNLDTLKTENFRLCCESVAPKTLKNGQCISPFDEVSSCSDLLRSDFLRVSLWVMAALTIVGNIGVITWRIFFDDSQRINFRIIVTNLAGSDLIMGFYLVIIGVGDASTRDEYLVHEEDWKSSIACKIAGYLCLLSTEVSAIFILVATIDRLLVIVFPLRREFHLTGKSATVVSIVVWLVGLTFSTIPLLPPFEHWNLYSQRPMGVPLPITTKDYPGLNYTFGIFIVFNIFVFILVCAGQMVIYLSVTRRHRPQMSESRMKQDAALAKRLALVVATDCLCWFPIATMGFLARAGIQIPVDMHVLTAVLVLPANSALNPFLYTINAILLRRKRMKSTSSNSSLQSDVNLNRK